MDNTPIEVILQPIDTKSELDSSLLTDVVPSPTPNHLNLTPPRPGNLSPGPPNNMPYRRTRTKAPPVCRVPALRKMNMSAESLSQWCFRPEDLLRGAGNQETSQDVAGGAVTGEQVLLGSGTFADQKISPNQWASFKKLILRRTESRNGRDLQRFATDPKTGHLMRLTTGSVPIMSDGRILLVSSSRKEEWILPKGGWESDETLKVSALRETYEEGGVLGTLGPKLTLIEYETKKAKKRRLEMESLQKKYEHGSGPVSGLPASLTKDAVSLSSSVSIHSTNSSVCHSEDDAMLGSAHNRDHSSPGDKEGMGLLAKSKYDTKSIGCDRADADAASLGSIASDTSSSCAYVRMTMFPLYVLEVREHWPESGRARKVVDIDTAIEMMKSRPEFHQVLLEVKKKGYHLNPHRRIQGDFVDKI